MTGVQTCALPISSPQVIIDLSTVYEEKDGVQPALKFIKKAIKPFPKSKELAKRYKELYARERQVQKEELLLKVDQAPSPIIYSRLATIFYEEGQLDEAEKLCKTSLEKYPDYGGAYQTLGDISHDRGEKKAALDYYEKALELNKNNFQVLKKLSQIYIDSGQINKAVGNLKQALRFNPGDEVIEEMLKHAEEGVIDPTVRIEGSEDQEAVEEPEVVDSQEQPAALRPEKMNLTLTIKDESGSVRVVPVTKQSFHIGRAANNDLMLDDKQHIVSRDHAYLEFKDGFYSLADNKSGNGTFLNGKKIKRSVVKNNDIIEIGNFRITVNLGDNSDPEKTMVGGPMDEMEQTMIRPPSSAEPDRTEGEQSTLNDTIETIKKIKGVTDVILVNTSGFVIASELSEKTSEESLGATVTRMSKTISQGELLKDIDQITGAVIDCEKLNIFVKVHSQFTIAVFSKKDCKRGLIQLEMDKVFGKI